MSAAAILESVPWKLRLLLELVARFGGQRDVAGPLIAAIGQRLAVIEHRVAAILQRIENGTLRRYPDRPAPAPARAAPRRRAPRTGDILPKGRNWLVRLVPETAQVRHALDFWVTESNLPALFAQAPQLRRALAPLFTMVGAQLPLPASAAPPQPPASAPPLADPLSNPLPDAATPGFPDAWPEPAAPRFPRRNRAWVALFVR